MTTPIAAITLHQPYATLIALGVKPDETRSWPAPRHLTGNLLAIHAGKATGVLAEARENRAEIALWDDRRRASFQRRTAIGKFLLHLGEAVPDLDLLPLGAVVCVARLIQCHRTETIMRTRSEAALVFGDYAYGRYAWALNVVHVFADPIPAQGKQGIWQWTPPTDFAVKG